MSDKEKIDRLHAALHFLMGTCRAAMVDHNQFTLHQFRIEEELAGFVALLESTKPTDESVD